jgi:asparagine synthase (glutamine-hydrolysing)
MPGIFGIIPKKHKSHEALLVQFDKMAKLLKHFDYYKIDKIASSAFLIGRIGIPYRGYGFSRNNEASGRGFVFDGYIYGWREPKLQKSFKMLDPALSIPLDDSYPLSDIPAMINGSFSIAIFDNNSKKLFLAKDRLGYRNLFLYEDDDYIAFAPEVKAFLALDSYRPEVDIEGVADFFNYAFLIGGRTLIKNVKHVYPATLIEISDNTRIKYQRYWNYGFEEELDGDSDLLASNLYDCAQGTLNRQLGDHDNFIMGLSGGMDSRALAHLISHTDKNVVYYAHGQTKSEDVLIANIVADKLGIIDNYRELRGDSECYANMGAWTAWLVDCLIDLGPCYLPSVVKLYTENPLDFEFMNSVFSGTLNFACLFGDKIDVTDTLSPAGKLNRLRDIYGAQYYGANYFDLFSADYKDKIKASFDSHLRDEFSKYENAGIYFISQLDHFMLETRILRLSAQFDLNKYFYHDHYALIDDELFKLYLTLPLNLKVNRAVYKNMFYKLMPDMANIRYQKTGMNLYNEPSKQMKWFRSQKDLMRYYLGRLSYGKINLYNYHNYTQPDQWYRKYPANRKFFENILLDPRTLNRGYFNAEAVKMLLKKQAHGSNSFSVISSLATFELFNRYFIDRDDPPKYER